MQLHEAVYPEMVTLLPFARHDEQPYSRKAVDFYMSFQSLVYGEDRRTCLISVILWKMKMKFFV